MDFLLRLNNSFDSPLFSVVSGILGIVTIAAVGTVDLFLSNSLKLLRETRKKTPRMKGVVIRSYRGISSVEVRSDLIVPRIQGEDEVLIKVVAAGLDRRDLMITWGYGRVIRSQMHRKHADNSMVILGRECSGIVLDVGQRVTTLVKGDEVWAVSPYCSQGLMAEFVVVKAEQVALKPRNLTFEEAASLPNTAIQVGHVLFYQAGLNSVSAGGKRILLLIGNTPFGLFAMQLLKSWDADVTAVVPTAGLPMCHVQEADDVIVYSVTNFEKELRRRRRFDLIINEVGTIVHALCMDVCMPGGQVITLTTTPILSDKYDFIVGSLTALAVQILGWIKKIKDGTFQLFWWDNFLYDNRYLQETASLVENKKIQPIIERVVDMEDVVSAFKELAKHDNVGKSVIRIACANPTIEPWSKR